MYHELRITKQACRRATEAKQGAAWRRRELEWRVRRPCIARPHEQAAAASGRRPRRGKPELSEVRSAPALPTWSEGCIVRRSGLQAPSGAGVFLLQLHTTSERPIHDRLLASSQPASKAAGFLTVGFINTRIGIKWTGRSCRTAHNSRPAFGTICE
jgi:hypothetical protein